MTHLTADGLSKRFGREWVFRGLSFEVGPGELVAVTGPNGAGKSTLLRILAGVLRATDGRVRFEHGGREIGREDRPLHAGMVAPYLSLYETFTARENLRFQARVRGLTGARPRIDALIERVGLSGRGDEQLAGYSSGMLQRVRIASALLSAPAFLLLDEPYTNLDRHGRELVESIVAEQRDRGIVQLLATNRERVASRCDRVVSVSAAD